MTAVAAFLLSARDHRRAGGYPAVLMSGSSPIWDFARAMCPNAFGRRGSRLATSRLGAAMAEIHAVAQVDPVRGAEGAVGLLERIAPAFAGIDPASGALVKATDKAVQQLVDVICAAPAGPQVREVWVARLRGVVEADGMGFLRELPGRLAEIAAPRRAHAAPPRPLAVSVSGTFREFLGATLEALADDREARESLLQVGLLAWNACVFADHCDNPHWLDTARGRLGPGPESALFESFVACKRSDFAAQGWLVRDAAFYERDGELRLRVEAGDPAIQGGAGGGGRRGA